MKYTAEYTREISFPIGGIGTGSIGLAGNGDLMDWEIFNRPSKGSLNGNTHFAIKAIKDNKPITYILNGDIQKDYIGQYQKSRFSGYGFGPNQQRMLGFTHFKNVEFDGEFPFANLTYTDEAFPGVVKQTAFNPFIPGDSENSSIPAAFFEIEVSNTENQPIKYQVAFSVRNPFAVSNNIKTQKDGCAMITMKNAGVDESDFNYGDLTVVTDSPDVFTQTYWYRGSWMDSVVTYWNEFNSVYDLKDRTYPLQTNKSGDDQIKRGYDTCTIAAELQLAVGERKKVRFVLSWNIPNVYNYWSEYKNDKGEHIGWKNYYATVYDTSLESAIYAIKNWDSLYTRTKMFKDALYSTTMPDEIIEAAAANLSILKSATVLRTQDGSFYGFEGCHENEGCCEGTCQHVWNYAYAMCFLFPDLERSIRDLEFKYALDTDGRMPFRMTMPPGREMSDHRACVDGQMGAVIKSYREWKISGDTNWLKNNWQSIKKALEYAWSPDNYDKWDFDKDGVLEGRQHHTLDMELFGPSSWLQSMYLTALKAAAEMAEFLGEADKAKEYMEIFQKGFEWTRCNLFNGKYFIQQIDLSDKSVVDKFDAAERYWNDEQNQIKYQIADGSSIDQVLGQWHADILGLGDVLDADQLSVALDSMMNNNYKQSMRGFVNPWRLFSLYDDSGTVICDYPDGAEKPKIPIPYCEETMTGFEYSFAGILCSRGMIDEGVKVTKAVRDRFKGDKRNPWNEFECGSNYARAMASYAMIPILSGFSFHMPNRHIGFNPRLKENLFSTVWSLEGAWGVFEKSAGKSVLTVKEGALSLKSFGASFAENITSLKIDGQAIDFTFKNGIIYFDETAINQSMEVEF